jgi:predicted RNA binding protein YcfA (HicA-like mRNA interferase family)
MPKLRPENPQSMVRKLRKLGFDGPYGGGKHVFMRHPQTGMKISVPIHKGRDIPGGTLRAILRQLGISVEEWSKL